MALLARDDDYELGEHVQEALGRIGQPAVGPLRACLFDRAQSASTRNVAAQTLAKIAEHHPDLQSDVVAALTARLDAAETQTPEDETLNGFIVSSLVDLKAEEALPAIRRAYDEDRVDTLIVDFDDVQVEFGVPGALLRRRPKLDLAYPKSGLDLRVKCTACGFERSHFVKKIYCDLATMDRRAAGEEVPYSEFVIPQRITCPKCGAIDQYTLGATAMLALTADLVGTITRKGAAANDGPVVFQRFTLVDGREMHPYEARDMYLRQIEAEPGRADLRLRYGNVLSFLGYQEEAAAQYQAAVDRDPANLEAAYNLANASLDAGELAAAQSQFERILAVAAGNAPLAAQYREHVQDTREILRDLTAGGGSFRLAGSTRGTAVATAGTGGARSATPVPVRVEKVGRNDACPCGSGKKYKKCHGR